MCEQVPIKYGGRAQSKISLNPIATIAAPTKMAEVSTETVEETEEETSEDLDTSEENKDTNTEN